MNKELTLCSVDLVPGDQDDFSFEAFMFSRPHPTATANDRQEAEEMLCRESFSFEDLLSA